MFSSIYIRRLLSGFLVLVFALSVTPKRFLHETLAKHIDKSTKKNANSGYQLSISGYNCNTDNLVAESPFATLSFSQETTLFTSFSSYIFSTISFTSIKAKAPLLRGPPAII